MPAVEATDSSAIVPVARSPRLSRAVAIINAVSPSPTPCAPRPASRRANPTRPAAGPVATVAALPTTTTASAASTTGRRVAAPPRRPSSGVATAPTISVTVSVHCAPASDTSKLCATAVISGAPRLPIAATTNAMKSSPATSPFGETSRWAAVTCAARPGSVTPP